MRKSILIMVLLCASCTSGVGRWVNQAVGTGTPADIATIPDALDAEYNLRSGFQFKDMEASSTSDSTQAQAKAQALLDLQARIDAFHSLTDSLRTYLNVAKGADPLATFNAAAAKRAELVKVGVDALKVK